MSQPYRLGPRSHVLFLLGFHGRICELKKSVKFDIENQILFSFAVVQLIRLSLPAFTPKLISVDKCDVCQTAVNPISLRSATDELVLVMSDYLPSMSSLESFAKASYLSCIRNIISYFLLLLGHFGGSSHIVDPRFVSSGLPLSAGQCFDTSPGIGLIYYGQNYLIYPSAYPPRSRIGVESSNTPLRDANIPVQMFQFPPNLGCTTRIWN